MCLFSVSFPEKHASFNSLLSFLESVVIVVLPKSKSCPLWAVCSCTNDALLCHHMAA